MNTGRSLAVDIHFDLICPWCFIGKRQLDRACERFAREIPAVGMELAWHPVQLLPDVPQEGLPFAVFYEQRLGSAEAVRLRRQQVVRAAADAGLELDLPAIQRMPNTARAHRLLQRVAGTGDRGLHVALLERLFAAYFQQGRDLGAAATLHALALEVGVPAALAVARDDDIQPLPVGGPVSGVPHFTFDSRLALAGARDADTLFEAMRQAVRVRGLVAA